MATTPYNRYGMPNGPYAQGAQAGTAGPEQQALNNALTPSELVQPAPSQPVTRSGHPNLGAAPMPGDIDPMLAAIYQKHNVTPGSRGSGLTDYQYWQNDAVNNAHGDKNYTYDRLDADLDGNGMDTKPAASQQSPFAMQALGSAISDASPAHSSDILKQIMQSLALQNSLNQ